ncbi:TetR/AcrR family transcriptional regulator [Conexibacter sp. CPCC 206217]|uniref:TetR/AcrR family transcriptional regulator n=1 Tax=Conexibacter sp. CPCC 206217 TaxID=3064574 RepID=UPI0027282102|nr:TetR family transcriptional regulator [Conexibacter sp. CPCC 206217]MDO8210296.1 TetR family transcriptional regulator [Conexibacter sp. CPCC 206217]
MRADALRNADAVLQTAAELLAREPNTSIGAIAAAAGVDRSTVYRRFSNRETLLVAIHAAKMDAMDEVFANARLEQAAPLVALHRWVEGTVAVSRRWPVDAQALREDPAATARGDQMVARLDAFVARAQAAGVVDPDAPAAWVRTLLTRATAAAAHELPALEPGPAADLVVSSLLDGVGLRRT